MAVYLSVNNDSRLSHIKPRPPPHHIATASQEKRHKYEKNETKTREPHHHTHWVRRRVQPFFFTALPINKGKNSPASKEWQSNRRRPSKRPWPLHDNARTDWNRPLYNLPRPVLIRSCLAVVVLTIPHGGMCLSAPTDMRRPAAIVPR